MEHENRSILLEGALNVRELGGLPVKDGRKIKSGKLIRAGRLSDLTDTDGVTLSAEWNVTTIVDLRNDQEISEHPDVIPDGIVFRKISILPDTKEGISREDFGMEMVDRAIIRAKHLREDGGAGNFLKKMYGQMAERLECIAAMREFFMSLLEQGDGCFLWHCTSGKDRTGVTGALLLYALGADMETIKIDYLYTNEQNRIYRENLLAQMKKKGAEPELLEEMRILESVDWSYIERFFHVLECQYGSIDRFLMEQIGLTHKETEIFLEKYTEQGKEG